MFDVSAGRQYITSTPLSYYFEKSEHVLRVLHFMDLPEEASQAFEAVKQRFLSRENRGAGDRSAPLLAAIAAD